MTRKELLNAIKQGLFNAEMKTRLASVELIDFQTLMVAETLINKGYVFVTGDRKDAKPTAD